MTALKYVPNSGLKVTNDEYIAKERQLAALLGRTVIFQAGQSLMGSPVIGGIRGQGLVPDWCRSWLHCGSLIGKYQIAISHAKNAVSASCRGHCIDVNTGEHVDSDHAARYAVVSVIVAALDIDSLVQKTCIQMREEVLEDIASGRIPSSVSDFSMLHDFVDANEYGGFCDDDVMEALIRDQFGGRDADEGMPQSYLDFMNICQSNINTWLETGGHHHAVSQQTINR